jgi:hypothetical protein
MAGKAWFEFDPQFDDNLLHWRDSLNPVGDVVRKSADKIRDKAIRNANAAVAEAASAQAKAKGSRYRRSGRQAYANARALVYSLKRYSELIYAAEVRGANANYAIVASGHAAADRIEFGGTDQVIKAGDQPLQYPALMILRRSI